MHHIYEYKKGLRDLVLHTISADFKNEIVNKLEKLRIPYLITALSNNRINVFFGNKLCVDVLKEFSSMQLDKITAEEDFIFGIMLGYGRKKQCFRYLRKKQDKESDLIAG